MTNKNVIHNNKFGPVICLCQEDKYSKSIPDSIKSIL